MPSMNVLSFRFWRYCTRLGEAGRRAQGAEDQANGASAGTVDEAEPHPAVKPVGTDAERQSVPRMPIIPDVNRSRGGEDRSRCETSVGRLGDAGAGEDA